MSGRTATWKAAGSQHSGLKRATIVSRAAKRHCALCAGEDVEGCFVCVAVLFVAVLFVILSSNARRLFQRGPRQTQ
eukprot:5770996-Prymnesium_polylepis.1